MDTEIQELLTLAENIIYSITGRKLDNLQHSIIESSLMGKTYLEIAEESGYTEGYVKDTGSKLWKIISEMVGEDIKKTNLKSRLRNWKYAIQSKKNSNNLNSSIQLQQINNFSVYGAIFTGKSINDLSDDKSPILINTDLAQMPSIVQSYTRLTEIEHLKKQILERKVHLIGITGLIGIGKTTLIATLIEEIKDQFDYIIWRNLALYSSLEQLQIDLINFLEPDQQKMLSSNNLNKLITIFAQKKCLIILDQAETIFKVGQLAGTYKPEYEKFRQFFELKTSLEHKSCIIFNSWSMSREMVQFLNNDQPAYLLKLGSLGEYAKEILKEANLKEEEQWPLLIAKYSGNPLWLKIVAIAINELFNGKVSDFLDYDIFPEDLGIILQRYWLRLTELEQKILVVLSQKKDPITLDIINENLLDSPSNIVNAIHSLLRRNLVEKNEENEVYLFNTLPAIKQFINYLIQRENIN